MSPNLLLPALALLDFLGLLSLYKDVQSRNMCWYESICCQLITSGVFDNKYNTGCRMCSIVVEFLVFVVSLYWLKGFTLIGRTFS